jgi:hypothetical protein
MAQFDLAAPAGAILTRSDFHQLSRAEGPSLTRVENLSRSCRAAQWSREKFDAIAETSQFADDLARSYLLRLFANGRAALLVPHPLMKNLPSEATDSVGDRTDSLGVAEARDKRRGSHLRNWFVGIVPQIVPQRVSTPDKQRHLRGHTGRHHSSAKSLEGPQKKCFGTSRHGSSAPLSKRAPSTTRPSLRLESTSCERPDRDYRTRRRFASVRSISFELSGLTRTDKGCSRKLCQTS